MHRYIIRRVILMVPTLIGLTMLVFVMVRLYPGDILALVVGDNYAAIDSETRNAILSEFSLDKNVPQQYAIWVGRLVRMDLGRSLLSGRDVQAELAQRLPVSIQLGSMALLFSVAFGVPIGVISALRRNSAADYVGRSFAVGMLSAPGFWLALILIGLAGRYAPWAVPPSSYPTFVSDPIANLRFMIVPAMILGCSASGGVMRFTRTAMLEVLRQDYIRTANAKGLQERAVVMKHALKNALIPVVTVIGLAIPGLVGGSVIMETVYSIPGMGRYYITAINQLDFPVVQAINLCTALVVLFSNLAVDVAYSWLDPPDQVLLMAARVTTTARGSLSSEEPRPRVRRGLQWITKFARTYPLGATGAVFVVVLVLMAVLPQLFTPLSTQDAFKQVLTNRLEGPSGAHWFGTDQLGRDIYTRIVYGARTSITLGFGVVLLTTFLSITLGTVSGYYGGTFDMLFQRLVDIGIAVPNLVFIILVVQTLSVRLDKMLPGHGDEMGIILALAMVIAAGSSRTVRGVALSLRQQQYVEAARALGASDLRVMVRHIVPNLFPIVIVSASILVGSAVLVESSLSFLGYGVQPPTPSWGRMLNDARGYLVRAPHMALFPGLVIFLTVFSFNMLGDALRDRLDPRLRGSN